MGCCLPEGNSSNKFARPVHTRRYSAEAGEFVSHAMQRNYFLFLFLDNLDRVAAEKEDEFDNEDDDHHQLKHKRAALVELVDHEAVELFGGL